MKLKTFITAGLLALAPAALLPASAQTLPQAAREKIMKATVMLIPTTADGKLDNTLGSGSIISPDGYILTNYHVVGDNDSRTVSDWIQVRTIRFADETPVPTYWGQVVASDPNLDLAIVKITETKDQKPVGSLNLPYVQMGDSNSLTIGDPIYVFGFQGTGGMTISYSQGTVSGFTGDDLKSSGRQWIKHDAQTGPGNSGGGVFDANGDLVAIHSAGVSGDHNSRTSFMRPLAVGWGLIAPNVSKYAVRPGTKMVASKPAATTTERLPSSSASSSSSGTADTLKIVPISSWPPKIAPGQQWFIALVGQDKGKDFMDKWQVTLTGLNQKGNPTGKATNLETGNKSDVFFYYSKEEDTVWLDMPLKDPTFMSCKFGRSSIKQGMLGGQWLFFKEDQDSGSPIGGCSAALLGGSSSTAASAPTQSGTQTSAQTSSGKLSWPLKPKPGQRYTINFPKFGAITLSLTGTDSAGATGTAKLSDGTEIDAYFYYDDKDKTTWLDLVDDKSMLYCAFDAKGISGNTLRGDAYYRKDRKDTQQDAEKLGTCTGKLN